MGKKIYEIEGYLDGRKIAHEKWSNKEYTYFKNGLWFDEDGDVYADIEYIYEDNVWKEYKEPQEPKRYWQWVYKDVEEWKRTIIFYEENGIDTTGSSVWGSWSTIEKHKIETKRMGVECYPDHTAR